MEAQFQAVLDTIMAVIEQFKAFFQNIIAMLTGKGEDAE